MPLPSIISSYFCLFTPPSPSPLTLTVLLFLEDTRHTYASGPLLALILQPGTLSFHMFAWFLLLPPSSPCPSDPFSMRPSLKCLFRILSQILTLIHSTDLLINVVKFTYLLFVSFTRSLQNLYFMKHGFLPTLLKVALPLKDAQ